MNNKIRARRCRLLISSLLIFMLGAGYSWGVAPTEEAIAKWQADGTFDKVMADWQAFHNRGGDSPSPYLPFKSPSLISPYSVESSSVDTIRVIVLLIDFPDYPASSLPVPEDRLKFDSLLFSDSTKHMIVNPTGSMTDYYREVTNKKLYLKGDVVGWLRMPNTYAYYVGSDNGFSKGPELAHDAVVAADPTVDFSRYDSNGDGHVDGVVIVHVGGGAEEGAYGIWSHMSQIYPALSVDGVLASSYTLNPSLSGGVMVPIGVFCHEFGHILGLPDLYTTTYTPPTSQGLGRWSLMASGNYNGGSKSPAHLDAWCKIRLGTLLGAGNSFVNLVDVTSNIFHAPIPRVESDPTIYRITESIGDRQEYWLVENRQPVGFDKALPGSGLCIYHVDNTMYNNNSYLHYMVGLEQADGRNDLALGSNNRGDAGDPWPGRTNNRSFDNFSNPNSRNYRDTATTQIAVWNITDSDSLMYANLDLSYSHPRLRFTGADSVRFDDAAGGNGNGVPEAGESVDFYCRIRNLMRPSYAWTLTMSCDNPSVVFDLNAVAQPGPLDPALASVTNVNPVRFHLPVDFKSTIAYFTTVIASDSVSSSGDRLFSDTLRFRTALGAPHVLVVDDDNGGAFEQNYMSALTTVREPSLVWNKKTAGTPPSTELNKYNTIFWLNGDPTTGGQFTAADVAALKDYLDHGHALAITSFTAGDQLRVLDSAFLRDYLHLRWKPLGTQMVPIVRGRVGNCLSGGLMYRLGSGTPSFIRGDMEPVGGGDTAFYPAYNAGTIQPGCTGVSFSGSFRTFFLSMPMEYFMVDTGDPTGLLNKWPMDTLVSHILNFVSGNVTYQIDATAGANGSISPSGTTVLPCGGGQSYTITPNPNYVIGDVLVDYASVGPVTNYTFSGVTSNRTISASFTPVKHTITATAGAHGSISPNGAVQVNHGGSQSFTISANSTYHVGDVLVNGSSVGAVPSYTFTNVTADQTISVTFASCCQGTTGNADGSPDGIVDISDIFAIVDFLSSGLPLSSCPAENDVNKDGVVDISDLFTLVDFVGSAVPLPPCP